MTSMAVDQSTCTIARAIEDVPVWSKINVDLNRVMEKGVNIKVS